MACGCVTTKAASEAERRTLRIALALNAAMFVIGVGAGFWSHSTALVADALDMLADASAYGLGLMAISRGADFKRKSARMSGSLLLILGLGIIGEAVRRMFTGTEPNASIMMVFATLSLVVNVTVLRLLAAFRHGEVHLRATWIFTRADVIANIGIVASGLVIQLVGWGFVDLIAGVLIGGYVAKEAVEILNQTSELVSPDDTL